MRVWLLLPLVIAGCKGSGSGPAATSAGSAATAPAPRDGTIVEPPPPVANGAAFAVGAPWFGLGTMAKRAVFSSDGKRIAACGSQRLAGIWDVATGRRITSILFASVSCGAIAWMPGEQALVVGSYSFDGSRSNIQIIDATTGKVTAETTIDGRDGVSGLVVVDARTVAIGASDGFSLWHLDRPTELLEAVDWKDARGQGAVAAGGVFAAPAQDYDHLRIRPIAGGTGCTVRAPLIGTFALSADGARLVVTERDELRIHDTKTCAERERRPAPDVQRAGFGADGQVRIATEEDVIAFAPDGDHVAVSTATGLAIHPLGKRGPTRHETPVTSLAVKPDGTVVSASRDRVLVWTQRGGARIALVPDGEMHNAAVDPSGGRVALLVLDDDRGHVDIVDVTTRTRRTRLDVTSGGFITWAGERVLVWEYERELLQLLPDGRRGDAVASGSMFTAAAASRDGKAIVAVHQQGALGGRAIDVYVPAKAGTLPDDGYDVAQMAIGARHVAIVLEDDHRDRLTGWSMSAYAIPGLTALPLASTDTTSASAAALRANSGEELVIGYTDGRVRIVDGTGKEQRTFASGAGRVVALAVSSDDKLLVSAHADGAMFVWNL